MSKPLSNLIRNPDAVLREEEADGGLLFNPDTSHIHVVNPTGLFIWRCCDGSVNEAAIVDKIRESFEDVPENIEPEVSAFVQAMILEGLIGYVKS